MVRYVVELNTDTINGDHRYTLISSEGFHRVTAYLSLTGPEERIDVELPPSGVIITIHAYQITRIYRPQLHTRSSLPE